MIVRALVTLLVSALGLLLMGDVLPGFNISGFGSALGMAAVCGLLNLVVWPVAIRCSHCRRWH